VTERVVSEKDVDKMFSKLDISIKSSQSPFYDPSSVDQLLKKRKSGPSGSSPDSHSHSLSDSHSLWITQHKNTDQPGK
jgi:hypothetical protein